MIFRGLTGSQYCSGMFQNALSSYGMRSSMSRKGDCWDNEPTESSAPQLPYLSSPGRSLTRLENKSGFSARRFCNS